MHVKGEVISPNDKACRKANEAPYCWDDQDCSARNKFCAGRLYGRRVKVLANPNNFSCHMYLYTN